MERYTPAEIVAFNSMLDGEEIFGLPVSIKTGDRKLEEIEEEVMKSLGEKGIIKEKGLTDKGYIITRMLESYKKARTHIFMNRGRLSLDGEYINGYIIEGKEIEILRKHKVKMIEDIVVEHPFLQQKQRRSFFVAQKEKVSKKEWENKYIEAYPNFIVIQKFKDQQLVEHQCLGWNEKEGSQYDYLEKTKLMMGARDIRMELLRIVEAEGVKKDGRYI